MAELGNVKLFVQSHGGPHCIHRDGQRGNLIPERSKRDDLSGCTKLSPGASHSSKGLTMECATFDVHLTLDGECQMNSPWFIRGVFLQSNMKAIVCDGS